MDVKSVRKLKKGQEIEVSGIPNPCFVTNKDATGLVFMERVPNDPMGGVTGIVNWPKGEFEDNHPAPTPITHALS